MRGLILLLCLTLTACAGHTIKRPIINNQGEVQRNWYGGIAYEKQKLSRTAVIEDASARKVEALANSMRNLKSPCTAIIEKEAKGVADNEEIIRSYNDCLRNETMVNLVAVALGRPITDIQAVVQSSADSVRATEENQTKRTLGIATGIVNTAIPVSIGVVARGQSKDRRDENVAGFDNAGDTVVNGLSVNTGQTASGEAVGGSPVSNDAEAGLLAGEGEGVPGSASSASPGGDGTATSSNTKTGDTVNLNIGRGSINTVADSGRQFIDTRSTQQLDTSANGGVNDGANVDQQPIVDSAQDVEFDNRPNVGVNNGQRENEAGE